MTTVKKQHRNWIQWLIAFELVFLFAPTIIWLYNRWTMSVWHNAHGFLIVCLVVYYIKIELTSMKNLPSSTSRTGLFFIVPALLILALDAAMHTQLLSAFSLYLIIPGLSLLFLGTRRTKAIGFFLFMLFLSLPIPLVLTESIHFLLRNIATISTAWVVPKLGVPVYSEGTALYIPNGTLQVADACSGFSTLYAAIAVACLTAYFSTQPLRKILIMLAAAPIAIAANILRVILLVLLVNWFGMEILDTSIHTISGLFTFALALPIIFWLGETNHRV